MTAEKTSVRASAVPNESQIPSVPAVCERIRIAGRMKITPRIMEMRKLSLVLVQAAQKAAAMMLRPAAKNPVK